MSQRAILTTAGSLAGVFGVVGFILTEFAKLPGVPLPAWVLGLVGIIGAATAAYATPGPGQVDVESLPEDLKADVKAVKKR